MKLGYYTGPSDATLARMYPFVPPGVNVQDWRRNLHHANILERGGTFTQLDPQISDKSLLDDFEVNQAIARTQKRLDDARLSAAQRHIDRENKLFEDRLRQEAAARNMMLNEVALAEAFDTERRRKLARDIDPYREEMQSLLDIYEPVEQIHPLDMAYTGDLPPKPPQADLRIGIPGIERKKVMRQWPEYDQFTNKWVDPGKFTDAPEFEQQLAMDVAQQTPQYLAQTPGAGRFQHSFQNIITPERMNKMQPGILDKMQPGILADTPPHEVAAATAQTGWEMNPYFAQMMMQTGLGLLEDEDW